MSRINYVCASIVQGYCYKGLAKFTNFSVIYFRDFDLCEHSLPKINYAYVIFCYVSSLYFGNMDILVLSLKCFHQPYTLFLHRGSEMKCKAELIFTNPLTSVLWFEVGLSSERSEHVEILLTGCLRLLVNFRVSRLFDDFRLVGVLGLLLSCFSTVPDLVELWDVGVLLVLPSPDDDAELMELWLSLSFVFSVIVRNLLLSLSFCLMSLCKATSVVSGLTFKT